MKPSFRFTYILVVVTILITACSPQGSPPPATVDVENAVRALSTKTSTPVVVPSEPATQIAINPTEIPTYTNTPIPAPTDVLALIGTPLAVKSETIDINN